MTVELERMSLVRNAARRAWLVRMSQPALLLVVVVLGLGLAREARATAQDDRLDAATTTAMSDDYPQNLDAARNRIQTELDRCRGGRCTNASRARAMVALGMIAGQNGHTDEAKSDFKQALDIAPDVTMPAVGVTPATRALWDEVKPPSAAASAPDPSAAAAGGSSIPGWNSIDAFKAAAAGLAADQAGNLELCIEKDRASLVLEEQPRTRLHLSSCERRNNKFVDALKDAQKALETGLQKRDMSVMKVARSKVEDLLKLIPHVTFVPPTDADNLEVKFDEREVSAASLQKRFSVDPGPHAVHAEGVVGGVPTTYDETFDVKPGELLTVRIHLNAPRPEFITKGQLRCTLAAKNQEEVDKCFPKNAKNIVVKMGLETAGYGDTDHVYVFTPSINASISSPTSGWNVGGTYVLDVLSAASPDIVSMASKRYKETRSAATLTGGYKPGLYGVQAQANFSREPDYFSRGAGLAVTGDFKDKLITPRLAFNYSLDTIGRRSLDIDTSLLRTSEIEGSVTFVLSPTSLLLVSTTGQFERGDQSKPYRFVPLFDPSIAPRVPAGAVVDLVNQRRLPYRPQEQLPTERDRYAIGARFAHRFNGINSTVRLEERGYVDTWGLKATTTDARFVVDAGKRLRLWPHVRYNVQTGVSFYQLAYSATVNATTGQLQIPTYRTGDRELSPMETFTGGGGVRYALSAPDSKAQWDLTLQGDVMYSKFFDSLFVTMRTALYGSLALDVEFE